MTRHRTALNQIPPCPNLPPGHPSRCCPSPIGSDPVLASLCEGIAEDTITGIGRFRYVFVIDRHSSIAVAQETADIAEIGRRLGIVYLVQGSLQKLGRPFASPSV
jgi:hypothetical protein